mgnify:CR=1 FL=1
MGIFADDEQQDRQIAAIESRLGELAQTVQDHQSNVGDQLRDLTQLVQANQADLVEASIAILQLQARLQEKVSVSDIDPAVVGLNEDLGKARADLEKSRAAASESWATLQTGVNNSFESLRASVREAYDRAKKAE